MADRATAKRTAPSGRGARVGAGRSRARRDATRTTKLRVVRSPARRPRKDPAVAARTSVILLLVSAALLTTIGVVEVFSASSVYAFTNYDNSFWFLERQAIYAAIGIGVAPDGADAVHGVAPVVGTARGRLRGAPAPGAPPDRRLVGLRRLALDRPGAAHAATVGVREARADRVHRGGPRAEGGQARRLAAPGAAARPRGAARRRDRDAPARPRHDDRDRRKRPDDAVRRRGAAPPPGGDRGLHVGRSRVPHLRNGVPARSLPVVRRPVEGSAEPRVSAHPRVDRARIRRVVRRRPRRQPAEMGSTCRTRTRTSSSRCWARSSA